MDLHCAVGDTQSARILLYMYMYWPTYCFEEPPEDMLVFRDIYIAGIALHSGCELTNAIGHFFVADREVQISGRGREVSGRRYELSVEKGNERCSCEKSSHSSHAAAIEVCPCS